MHHHILAARGKRAGRLAIAMAALALCAMSGGEAEARRLKRPSQPSAPVQAGTGVASFYGGREHGGPTASGERFNMNAMTAAHRTAPLGSQLRVTNLRNGRSVVVRINDRGPFVRGRIIDLSKRAAEELGFVSAGLTHVRVEPVS